jgi:hypothetical protein
MAEQFLHDADTGPVREHVRCARVPEQVRADACAGAHCHIHAVRGQPPAHKRDQQRAASRPAACKVLAGGRCGFRGKRNDASFVSLTGHANGLPFEVNVFHIHLAHLVPPQPGTVCKLDH